MELASRFPLQGNVCMYELCDIYGRVVTHSFCQCLRIKVQEESAL